MLCETNELLMLIIENKRSAERRMRLNEFKSAFVRQSKQPFGAALPLVSEQPGLAVKIIAEAVIYVFKARVRNGAYALLPVQFRAKYSRIADKTVSTRLRSSALPTAYSSRRSLSSCSGSSIGRALYALFSYSSIYLRCALPRRER